MDWWNSFLQWLASDEGWRVLSGAIIPAAAIVVAGVIAALIGRGSTKRLIVLHQRDALTAAVGGFVLAGQRAAEWNALTDVERVQLDHLAAETETRIRLLPIAGAGLAATWAAHELSAMKRDSAGFQFQTQQTLADYRDRLVAWSEKPRAAKKLFGADLERWQFEADQPPSSPETDSTAPSTRAPSTTAPSTAPVQTWVASGDPLGRSPLTPEPPTAVATATGSMPLIITTPMPTSRVRARVLPASAG